MHHILGGAAAHRVEGSGNARPEGSHAPLGRLGQRPAEAQLAAEEALKAKEEKLLAMEQENAARLLELEALRAEIEAARVA